MKEKSSYKNIRITQVLFNGSLQLILLPLASGLLTTAFLTTGLIRKFNLKSPALSFPTIKFLSATTSTYSGLILAASLGCIIGLLIFQILKFSASFMPFGFNLINIGSKKIPSSSSFFSSLLSIIAFPAMIILAAVSVRDLSKFGLIPKVIVDLEHEIFEVTPQSIAIIAATACMLMFLYEMILKSFLKIIFRS